MAMVFGSPADSSTLARFHRPGPLVTSAQLGQELDNQAVYIQRPEHEGRRPWWFWPALLATFVLSAIAWRPVLRPLVYGRRPHGGLEHAERVERDGASPHVHVFHEPRCAGESVTLKGAADLCGRHYPSGEPLKDNVASVLLSGAAVMLDVYGTCKLAEKPANPMLLESVGQQGCTELTAPIAGHVEIRPVDRVEL